MGGGPDCPNGHAERGTPDGRASGGASIPAGADIPDPNIPAGMDIPGANVSGCGTITGWGITGWGITGWATIPGCGNAADSACRGNSCHPGG
jgi:hypothetical protein